MNFSIHTVSCESRRPNSFLIWKTSPLSRGATVGTVTRTVILSAATFIMAFDALSGQCVDHINKNKADNRKKNLRCCERSENDRNRSLYSCNTSGVAGVYFDKQRKKWVASITYNHKKVYLGRYAVKEEAILARLTKEVELYKEFSPQRELLESLNL